MSSPLYKEPGTKTKVRKNGKLAKSWHAAVKMAQHLNARAFLVHPNQPNKWWDVIHKHNVWVGDNVPTAYEICVEMSNATFARYERFSKQRYVKAQNIRCPITNRLALTPGEAAFFRRMHNALLSDAA